MSELNIDLKLQEIEVFDKTESPLVIMNKSFIFGKNGAGKSSLCRIIKSQFSNEYDVRIFTGFEGVLVDEKLNAVVLGEENEDIKKMVDDIDHQIIESNKDIDRIQIELDSLNWKPGMEAQGIEQHKLKAEYEEVCILKKKQEDRLSKYYTEQARRIKDEYQSQIKNTNYSKPQFVSDISTAKKLDKESLDKYKTVLSETFKESISYRELPTVSGDEFIQDINRLLQKTVKETFPIEELSESSEKKSFARKGMELHKSGDVCSYCGNIVTNERMEKLKQYFSSKDIEAFQQELRVYREDQLDVIKEELIHIQDLDAMIFYQSFSEEVREINKIIHEKKKSWLEFIAILEEAIEKKRDSLFASVNSLEVEPILNFDKENRLIFELIEKNNAYSSQLSAEQQKASNSLRFHYVSESLKLKKEYKKDWKGYEVELFRLEELSNDCKKKYKDLRGKIQSLEGNQTNPKNGTLYFANKAIKKLSTERQKYLEKTKNAGILAQRINEKLFRVGKNNLELVPVIEDDKVEHYQIKDEFGMRAIDKISTGEKNIIAFLYFMEQLDNPREKNRIIIFDDPMNSNDDTMQYLIITEIQKLYQGRNKGRFNVNSDYFICMTHNAHFYLNVQPQGNMKIQKKNPDNPEGKLVEVSKYDKNTFCWIQNGKFERISSEKNDLNTHYEFLWMELGKLYENNMLNSMLNSMRRIIETYIHFNKIHPDQFYEDMDEHRKLFNVNSHAVDDLSAELIGKNKEEILQMFQEIFNNNNVKAHYDNYKNQWSLCVNRN